MKDALLVAVVISMIVYNDVGLIILIRGIKKLYLKRNDTSLFETFKRFLRGIGCSAKSLFVALNACQSHEVQAKKNQS